MADPFIGQIYLFAGNFPIRGYANCEGQLLSISQNSALFSILGTTYGGDGRSSFGLPDLRGRFAMHPGTGAGLPTYRLGERGGNYQTNIAANQLPAHVHSFAMPCNNAGGDTKDPTGAFPSIAADPPAQYSSAPNNFMGSENTGSVGANQSLSLQNPFLCINFQIALVGNYPSRN